MLENYGKKLGMKEITSAFKSEMKEAKDYEIKKYKQEDINFIFKNNNPGSIKVSSDWKGETYTGASGEKYKKYPNKIDGLIDIITTIKKYNSNNIDEIMSIYATDDPSGKVIKNYSKILKENYNVPTIIDFNNKDHLLALLKGIIHIENSVIKYKGKKYEKPYLQYYKKNDMKEAINQFLQ